MVISKTEAVLRIALGSDSLRNFISYKDQTLKEDIQIIKKMAYLVKVGLEDSKKSAPV